MLRTWFVRVPFVSQAVALKRPVFRLSGWLKLSVIVSLAGLGSLMGSGTATAQQLPPSQGCTAVNNGNFDFTTNIGTGTIPISITETFTQGEVLTFQFVISFASVTSTAQSNFDMSHQGTGTTIVNALVTGVGNGASGAFTISSTGSNTFSGSIEQLTGETRNTFSVTCQPSTARSGVGPGNTMNTIRSFLHRRADLLLESEPDRPRLLRRTPPGSDANPAGINSLANLQVNDRNGAHDVSFSASFGQMFRSMAREPAKRKEALDKLAALGFHGPTAPLVPDDGVDVWVEAHYTHFEDDIGGSGADGHLGVIYLGLDQLINSSLLVGFLGQFDWAEYDSAALGTKAKGEGWMVGPYISSKLTPHLYFDARAAIGRSDSEVSPLGTFTDAFDTDRWLVNARLSGNWHAGDLRITPEAAVSYINEHQEGYTDSLGTFIPDQTASIGRLKFGPEFGYRHTTTNGLFIEPQFAIKGLWNFDDTGSLTVGNMVVGTDDFRARVEGGILVRGSSNVSFWARGVYDGIGDNDFEAYTGKLWVNVPLN